MNGVAQANKAALAFARKADIAKELEISRSTLQKFFSGKAISRENFHLICQHLSLDWRTIADLPNDPNSEVDERLIRPEPEPETAIPEDIETLVQLVRQQGHSTLHALCSSIRVLGMSQPVALNDLYISTKFLPKVNGRRRISRKTLTEHAPRSSDFQTNETRVDALEVVERFDKLIVLGHPGTGKTLLLKYLALLCNTGRFQAKRVPIFCYAKDLAEMSQGADLLKYIQQYVQRCDVLVPQLAERLLQQGRILILIDGLDEVDEQNRKRLSRELQQLSVGFPLNQFVMSYRIATQDYTFEKFSEVQIASFDARQVKQFVHQWFANKDPGLGNWMINILQSSAKHPVQELTSNPLLLTYLCQMLAEGGKKALNHCEIFHESLDILLRRWDSQRNIDRKPVDHKLSLSHKVELLSQIAWKTFQRGDYFLSQDELEHSISHYLCNLYEHRQSGQIDAEAVLDSIEGQHGLLIAQARGVYSFSSLGFLQYFSALAIVNAATSQRFTTALTELVGHLLEPRWRDIFLLTVCLLPQPDPLLKLMQQRTHNLLNNHPQLQRWLRWLQLKSTNVSTLHSAVVVRAFYVDMELTALFGFSDQPSSLAATLNNRFYEALSLDLTVDLALYRILTLMNHLERIPDIKTLLIRVINQELERIYQFGSAEINDLKLELQQLKASLPLQTLDQVSFDQWWQVNGMPWIEQLRVIMISHRNIGYDWQFNAQQKQILIQYHRASCLWAECLTQSTRLTAIERHRLEQSFL